MLTSVQTSDIVLLLLLILCGLLVIYIARKKRPASAPLTVDDINANVLPPDPVEDHNLTLGVAAILLAMISLSIFYLTGKYMLLVVFSVGKSNSALTGFVIALISIPLHALIAQRYFRKYQWFYGPNDD